MKLASTHAYQLGCCNIGECNKLFYSIIMLNNYQATPHDFINSLKLNILQ